MGRLRISFNHGKWTLNRDREGYYWSHPDLLASHILNYYCGIRTNSQRKEDTARLVRAIHRARIKGVVNVRCVDHLIATYKLAQGAEA